MARGVVFAKVTAWPAAWCCALLLATAATAAARPTLDELVPALEAAQGKQGAMQAAPAAELPSLGLTPLPEPGSFHVAAFQGPTDGGAGRAGDGGASGAGGCPCRDAQPSGGGNCVQLRDAGHW